MKISMVLFQQSDFVSLPDSETRTRTHLLTAGCVVMFSCTGDSRPRVNQTVITDSCGQRYSDELKRVYSDMEEQCRLYHTHIDVNFKHFVTDKLHIQLP